ASVSLGVGGPASLNRDKLILLFLVCKRLTPLVTRISLPLQPSLLLSLSSRPTWRDGSRARPLLRYSLLFRFLDLIQLGLNIGQCPEGLPPRFVLLLQARRSRRMMRSVQGGVTLLEPLALHGFLQRAHHEVGFLHEFVNEMGPFPWFHAWPPFRLLV